MSIKPPELKSEMMHPEFRKFRIDWNVFNKLTNPPDEQVAPQLYNACDTDVQNAIISTTKDFFELDEGEIMETLE